MVGWCEKKNIRKKIEFIKVKYLKNFKWYLVNWLEQIILQESVNGRNGYAGKLHIEEYEDGNSMFWDLQWWTTRSLFRKRNELKKEKTKN